MFNLLDHYFKKKANGGLDHFLIGEATFADIEEAEDQNLASLALFQLCLVLVVLESKEDDYVGYFQVR